MDFGKMFGQHGGWEGGTVGGYRLRSEEFLKGNRGKPNANGKNLGEGVQHQKGSAGKRPEKIVKKKDCRISQDVVKNIGYAMGGHGGAIQRYFSTNN